MPEENLSPTGEIAIGLTETDTAALAQLRADLARLDDNPTAVLLACHQGALVTIIELIGRLAEAAATRMEATAEARQLETLVPDLAEHRHDRNIHVIAATAYRVGRQQARREIENALHDLLDGIVP